MDGMKLGVISDTHDKLATIDLALEYFAEQRVGLVVHCGDWKSLSAVVYFANKAYEYHLPVVGLLGNNDLDVTGFLNYAKIAPGNFTLQEGVFELALSNNKRLLAYHGHHKPTLRKVLASNAAVILLGHSHKPLIEQLPDKLIVNPGSTAFAIPRRKDWRPSVAIVDTGKLEATNKFLL